MPPPSATRARRCEYCAALLAPGPGGWQPAAHEACDEPLVDPARPRAWIGGARYALLGRLARGEGSDVFLARRDRRLTELVSIKALRAHGDRDLLEREQWVLESLENSRVAGAAHFTRLVPQRVAHGLARLGLHGDEGERRVSVMRWRSGFVHTMRDVLDAYPSGVSAETSVWMWKRILEQLGWTHRSGWVHGAVLPEHLIVHARDHGVVLVGWSRAARPGESLVALTEGAEDFYPSEAMNGVPVSTHTDLTMSARVMRKVLGSQSIPAPLAQLLETHARGDADMESDAWALKDRLDRVAREAFGPPRFVPFAMPGW
ncbi:hypothetical protein [Sandaracinus amylolyticus]|uniref:hypothetical protein n=1 Tax=Sandaracinus amylolyticus TaxID=927083 RepID=UPI001F2E2F1C|nr:hypothetical protein [Sandaracinus amylolyticus]